MEEQIKFQVTLERECTNCKITKPLKEFSWRPSKYKFETRCVICVRTLNQWRFAHQTAEQKAMRSATRYDNKLCIKEAIILMKRFPCEDCKVRYHYSAMDFDHVRGEKKGDISRIRSYTKLAEELGKCDLVCSNCHRLRTWCRQNNKIVDSYQF